MHEQDLRWAPLPPQPKKAGRVWLIVGLVVAALAIVGALLFFFLPRSPSPSPTATPSSTPTASSSASPTPAPSRSTTPSPSVPSTEPTEPPMTTPPPMADPTVEVFRGKVSGWLTDAPRGLDIIAGATGQDALPVVDTLQQDAQRLSDAVAPSSIDKQWRDGVSAYATSLTKLRSAISNGSGVSAAVDAARSSAQQLRSLVGL